MEEDKNCLTFRLKKTDEDLKNWIDDILPDYDSNFSLLVRQALREKMNREINHEAPPRRSPAGQRPVIAAGEERPKKEKKIDLEVKHESGAESDNYTDNDLKEKLAKLGGRF